jgi:hypothetical protein
MTTSAAVTVVRISREREYLAARSWESYCTWRSAGPREILAGSTPEDVPRRGPESSSMGDV